MVEFTGCCSGCPTWYQRLRGSSYLLVNRKNGANFYSENFALEMCIIHNTFYASQDEFSFEVVSYLIL